MGLDKTTEQLFRLVLDNADRLHTANPHLFEDLRQGLPYEVLGSGLDGELGEIFGRIFEGFCTKDRAVLSQLRDGVGKETAAAVFLNSLIYYQMSMYTSRRD